MDVEELPNAIVRVKPDHQQFGIDAPLILYLEHEDFSADDMFRLAFILDGFELRRDPADPTRRIKHRLIFDVVEMEPRSTTVKATPRRPLTHEELRVYVTAMIDAVRETMGHSLRLQRMMWEMRDYGIPSDERTTLRRI